jgi:beta-N-acetylhexosaminidase
MFDLQGYQLQADEIARLESPAAGGIILFTRNYQNPEQLQNLIRDIRQIRPGLLIAVDHEGGRVQRFQEGFTRLPPAACYRSQPDGENLARKAGWLMAMELRSFGVDFSFAPVLDVEAGLSQIIADRAFASEAAEVARLAAAFMHGMHTAGMAATGKHFPGHGHVAADSHLELPVDTRSHQAILEQDIHPFKALIDRGLEAIMPAHVVYPAVDHEPAGYSKIWLQGCLRAELGFKGLIFSDDLSMAGAETAGSYGARAHKALQAGCDMVLVCNAPDAAQEVLEATVGLADSAERSQRLHIMCGRFPVDRSRLLASPAWQQAVHSLEQLNND